MEVKVTNELVNTADGQVFVRQWQLASATATPILLLHDSLGSVEQWRKFPEHLAIQTQRSVIAYDRLGFGQSSPRQTPAAFDFIDDEAQVHLPAVVQALGIDRYVLFGHSVGGGMALTAAAIAGAGCVAVISEAAQAFVEERTLAGIRAAKQSFAVQAQFAKLEKWHGERARWVLEAWTEIWLASEFRQWSLDAILNKVHCPVLVLHGEHDEFGSPAFPQRIVQGVSGPASLKLLQDCGHVPHREQENEVLSLVRDFLHNQAIP